MNFVNITSVKAWKGIASNSDFLIPKVKNIKGLPDATLQRYRD